MTSADNSTKMQICFFGCGKEGRHYCVNCSHVVLDKIDEKIQDLNGSYNFHQCPVCLITWCCGDTNCQTLVICNNCDNLSIDMIKNKLQQHRIKMVNWNEYWNLKTEMSKLTKLKDIEKWYELHHARKEHWRLLN